MLHSCCYHTSLGTRSLNTLLHARPSPLICHRFAPTIRRSLSTETPKSQNFTPPYYEGPLTATFRRLKIFSLSSLSLSVVFTPFLFLLEASGLPLTARFGLATVALSTSGISTGLVAWCGQPYVTKLERLAGDQAGVKMTTLTLALNERVTRVYDTAFLVDSTRPFARWELADHLQLDGQYKERITPGTEETVAEMTDARGVLLGRWVVRWDENGKGTCREVGKINRHFNVHEELLPSQIR